MAFSPRRSASKGITGGGVALPIEQRGGHLGVAEDANPFLKLSLVVMMTAGLVFQQHHARLVVLEGTDPMDGHVVAEGAECQFLPAAG
ncbi:UNVERIFIED_ORG: hypothetical protein GGD59_002470 [Rhizobium esperanzae]